MLSGRRRSSSSSSGFSSSSSRSSSEEDEGPAVRRSSVAFAEGHQEIPLVDPLRSPQLYASSEDEDDSNNNNHRDVDLVDAMIEDMERGRAGSPSDRRLSHSEQTGSSRSVGSLTQRNQRTSNVVDLETGKVGGCRAHTAMLRKHESEHPQSATVRRRRKIFNFFFQTESTLRERAEKLENERLENGIHTSKHGQYLVASRDLSMNSEWSGGDREQPRQYRLNAVHTNEKRRRGLLGKWMGFTIYEGTQTSPACSCFGINPNNLVIHFLHWIFRQHLVTVILTAVIGFFVLTIAFALLIWFSAHNHPYCVNGVEYEANFFTDAFVLSWTTFSTVGYGVISAGISTEDGVENIHECVGITVLVTYEAFVGILFSSMWGAIIFIRLSRIQSFAQVSFSDPIVIRYGSGVAVNDDDSDGGSHSTTDDDLDQIPCPILEFRVANRMHNVHGGEIIDSTVVVVASIDASQACPTLRPTTSRRRRGGKKGKKGGRSRQTTSRQMPRNNSSKDMPPPLSPGSNLKRLSSTGSTGSVAELMADASRPTQELQEDPSGHLVPKKILTKLECESQEHPFFKRVWMIRHKLDVNSPLLKAHARSMLKLNNGFWPPELNTAEGVRAAFEFDQLLVSLSGTSNADANSVYAQHIYDYVDVSVGYRFVNMLYRDPVDDSLRVDLSLISDVMEQGGGGGEDLTTLLRREKIQDMFVL